MDHYYGFDLGDAESAVARLNEDKDELPQILKVKEAESFVTACAQLADGELLIGESACYAADAVSRKIRFKSRYLRDPESRTHLKRFAAGVIGELYGNGDLISINHEGHRFTWRVQGLTEGATLRLPRLRVKDVEDEEPKGDKKQ